MHSHKRTQTIDFRRIKLGNFLLATNFHMDLNKGAHLNELVTLILKKVANSYRILIAIYCII